MKHLYLLLIGCALTFAQAPPKDRVGSKNSAVLTRLPGCWIVRGNVTAYALYFSLHAAEQKCTTSPATVFLMEVAVET